MAVINLSSQSAKKRGMTIVGTGRRGEEVRGQLWWPHKLLNSTAGGWAQRREELLVSEGPQRTQQAPAVALRAQ